MDGVSLHKCKSAEENNDWCLLSVYYYFITSLDKCDNFIKRALLSYKKGKYNRAE